MNKKIVVILGSLVCAVALAIGGFVVLNGQWAVADAHGCSGIDPKTKLVTEYFSGPNGEARVKNTSTDCSYKVGLASYKAFSSNIDTQVLFDNDVKTIAPGEVATFKVDLPSCAYQIDLFYGDLITSFAGGVRYSHRLLAGQQFNYNNFCSPAQTQCPTGTLSLTETRKAITDGTVKLSMFTSDNATKMNAQVVNNTGCVLPVSLITYKMFDQKLSTQVFFDGTPVVNVAAHSTSTLTNQLPTCMAQSDLYYGEGPKVLFDDNRASNITLKWKYHMNNGSGFANASGNFCGTTVTVPTPTVSTSCEANMPKITVNWQDANMGAQGYHVDVASNADFSTGGWYADISSGTLTKSFTDFNGMTSFGSAPGNLVLEANKTYKVRIFYTATGKHSPVVTVTTSNCAPQNPSLGGSCVANPTSVGLNDPVTWTASATGGTGTYTYSWTGTDNLASQAASTQKSYSTSGTKEATVVITSGNQSVTKKCTVIVTQPQNSNFDATCRTRYSSIRAGDSATFTASASGGTGSYTYSWSGSGVSGNDSSATKTFTNDGMQTVQVVVTSGSESLTRLCHVEVLSGGGGGRSFSGSCRANPTSGKVGDTITWTASARGGNGDYTYSWSGTDNLSAGNSKTVLKSYQTAGTKTATVTIKSGSRTTRETCEVEIDRVSGSIVVNEVPSQDGGVYLSEVPYTGIGSGAKVTLFMLGLLFWSVSIAWILIRRKAGKNGLTVAELIGPRSPYNRVHGLIPQTTVAATHTPLPAIRTMHQELASTPVASLASVAPEVKVPTDTTYETIFNRVNSHSFSFDQKELSLSETLEARARELNALISVDGLETLIDAAKNNTAQALALLDRIVAFYKATARPEANNWITLNDKKINQAFVSIYEVMTRQQENQPVFA